MTKKYEILKDQSIEWNRHTLYRIRALKSFGDIEEGDIGGFVQNPGNLHHEGDCWLYDDAKVFEYARVYGNAKVSNCACVYGYANVFEEAQVRKCAQVYDSAYIQNRASVGGNVAIYGDAWILGNAKVYDRVKVYGDACIKGDTIVYGNSEIYNYVTLSTGEFKTEISSLQDFIIMGVNYANTTLTKDHVQCGCFSGTPAEFEQAVLVKYGETYGCYADVINVLKIKGWLK